MIQVKAVNPCEAIVKGLVSIQHWSNEGVRNSRLGLAGGVLLSMLAGAPMPLPQVALAGPVLATLAAGALGGRLAAAIGFVAYLGLAGPSPIGALVAGTIAALLGWSVPHLLASASDDVEAERSASAVVVDCEGFSSLDATYGEGTGGHVFRLLQQALRMETREDDLVVQADEREMILLLDGSDAKVARSVMERVERRFSIWLSDAGYDCDLTVGFSSGNAPLFGRARPNGLYFD